MWHRDCRACRPLSQPPFQAVGISQEQSAERKKGEEMDPGYIWPVASSLTRDLGEDGLGPPGS